MGTALRNMIVLEDVCLSIAGRQIIDRVSLTVKKGDVAIFLGPSGAGKSTLLRIILGLWRPTSGKVTIDGIDITSLDEEHMHDIRRRMGVVFQGNALFDSLTVQQNVGYFLQRRGAFPKEALDRKVAEALAFVHLQGQGSLYPDELSGGMKKRVAIARAVVSNPDIILYDEPTTGLDPINTRAILDLIRRLKARGTTSVVVTHVLKDAFAIGDTFTLINEGTVVAAGSIRSILSSQHPFVAEFMSDMLSQPPMPHAFTLAGQEAA